MRNFQFCQLAGVLPECAFTRGEVQIPLAIANEDSAHGVSRLVDFILRTALSVKAFDNVIPVTLFIHVAQFDNILAERIEQLDPCGETGLENSVSLKGQS